MMWEESAKRKLCTVQVLLWAALLTGTVVDPAGRPVAGAVVRLQSPREDLAIQLTTAGGEFRISDAPSGRFLLSVEKPGFAPWVRPVALEAGSDLRLQIALELGPRTEHVTVSAEAGAVLEPHRTPQRLTLIPASLLEKQATRTLSEAFAGEPGVAEQRTAPAMGSVFVRGLTGKNVSVYRDGIRVTTAAQRGGVSTFFNLLEPAGIETVEVLRGPNSALYGSDSAGGAVHIVSRGAPLSPVSFFSGSAAALYDSATHGGGSQIAPAFYGRRFSLALHLAGRRVNTARTGRGLDSHSAITRFLGLPSSSTRRDCRTPLSRSMAAACMPNGGFPTASACTHTTTAASRMGRSATTSSWVATATWSPTCGT